MISKSGIEGILERQAVPDSPVLSVYLDVDQGKAINLNRGFLVSLQDMLRPIEAQLDKKQLRSFSADAERVQQFVSDFQPRAKGLIIFCKAYIQGKEVPTCLQERSRANSGSGSLTTSASNTKDGLLPQRCLVPTSATRRKVPDYRSQASVPT
jgi:hypothetical protein